MTFGTKPPLLEIRGLSVAYPSEEGEKMVVERVDLRLAKGEIHGLVGESGAGKSTVGNAVIGLVANPGRIVGGTIFFWGQPLALDEGNKGPVRRGRDIGVIFQDPLTSLNPLFTIESQISENVRFHKGLNPREARRRALELIDAVGIPDPEKRLGQYPHHLSGGMQQRVVIAMALSCDPKLIIADEPTTALDVSIRTQILDLVQRLCKERGVGVLLVTHDIGLISETVDNITVMYKGRVVENGITADILGRPQHPYTKSLMAAVPRIDVKLDRFPRFSWTGRTRPLPHLSARHRSHRKPHRLPKGRFSTFRTYRWITAPAIPFFSGAPPDFAPSIRCRLPSSGVRYSALSASPVRANRPWPASLPGCCRPPKGVYPLWALRGLNRVAKRFPVTTDGRCR